MRVPTPDRDRIGQAPGCCGQSCHVHAGLRGRLLCQAAGGPVQQGARSPLIATLEVHAAARELRDGPPQLGPLRVQVAPQPQDDAMGGEEAASS